MSKAASTLTRVAVRVGQAMFLLATIGAFVTIIVMLLLPFAPG